MDVLKVAKAWAERNKQVFNLAKSGIIVPDSALNKQPEDGKTIQGIQIVTKYTYLGIVITKTLTMTAACDEITDKLRKTFAGYRHLLANFDQPSVKRHIVTTLVESVIHSKSTL